MNRLWHQHHWTVSRVISRDWETVRWVCFSTTLFKDLSGRAILDGMAGLTKTWWDSENGKSACPAVSDRRDKLSRLSLTDGTHRQDLENGSSACPIWNWHTGQWKRSIFLSFEHTTDGAVKKHIYYDANGQWTMYDCRICFKWINNDVIIVG